jgi:PAS domain S-box-containing protein
MPDRENTGAPDDVELTDAGGDPPCWAHLNGGSAGTDALAVTDELLAAVTKIVGDGIVIADPDGRIAFWNAAAERIFGWAPADALGESLDLIIPERNRSAHWSGYEKTMATGETRYGNDLLRVPAMHKDGSRRSIAFTVSLLTTPDGAVGGIIAVIRDETARRAEEQELRQQLRELQEAAGQSTST